MLCETDLSDVEVQNLHMTATFAAEPQTLIDVDRGRSESSRPHRSPTVFGQWASTRGGCHRSRDTITAGRAVNPGVPDGTNAEPVELCLVSGGEPWEGSGVVRHPDRALGLMGVSDMDGMIRVRSVAVFATAVMLTLVCTLVVTHAWSVGAAPGDTDSTFVPTAGCRLADTRLAPNNVGSRDTPLGAGGIFEVTVHGSTGECTGALAIPTDAVAVALNVTAVNATATSNIRLYPANLTEVPLLSNLNVTAGAPAIPNKVDVKLSPDGKIRVFNEFGSVNVILDVVGYYTNSTLQELSQRVAALEAGQSALEAAKPFAVTNLDDESFVTPTDSAVVAVTVTGPVAGQVTVNSTTFAFEATAEHAVQCSITTGTTLDGDYIQYWESPGQPGRASQLAGTRTFDIAAGSTATYNLVCRHIGTFQSSVGNSVLTAIFTPAP